MKTAETSPKEYRSALYFQDLFFTLNAAQQDPAAFLHLPDLELLEIFENEIQPIIESNLGTVKISRMRI